MLDFVQAALSVAECVEGGEVSTQLFLLRTAERFLRALYIFAHEVEQVALGEKIILRIALGHAAEEGAHGLVGLHHDRQRLVFADGRNTVDHAVLQPFGYAQANVRENAAEMLGQNAVNGRPEDGSGFPTLPFAKGSQCLKIIRVPTPGHLAGEPLHDGHLVLPLGHRLQRHRQLPAFQ